jgi:hypothetical protein
VSTDPQYYLLKKGFYYRPKAQGYCEFKREAGLFSTDEADAHIASCHGEVMAELANPVDICAIKDDQEAFEAWYIRQGNGVQHDSKAVWMAACERKNDALRLALAASRDEAEKAKADRDQWKNAVDAALDKKEAKDTANVKLSAECESLRADKARLDWLANQNVESPQPGSHLGTMHLSQCFNNGVGRSWFTKEIRAAIDAARADAARKEQT